MSDTATPEEPKDVQSVEDYEAFRAKKVEYLLDQNHRVVQYLRNQNQSFNYCAEVLKDMALACLDIGEAAAIAARKSADAAGDIISAEMDIVQLDPEGDEENED